MAHRNQSKRCNSLVAIGGIAEIGMCRSPEGSVANDPEHDMGRMLFDHLVGALQGCFRNSEAKRLGGLEIDGKLK